MVLLGYQGIVVTISIIGGLVGLIWGISTSGQANPQAYLDRQLGMTTATPARRLGGSLLDSVLVLVTLGIGWLIWFAIVAPRGQTPGKSLVSTYVIREDGRRAGGWYMWGREWLVKGLLFNLIIPFGSTIGALWCLWDDDRQCLWDKVVGSYVAYSPYQRPEAQLRPATIADTTPAGRLRELQQLRSDDLITPEEYEERRRRLVESV